MDDARAGRRGLDPSTAPGALTSAVLCGRYRLDRQIGMGGMAQVWEGTDTVLGRRVAVKVLHPHLAQDQAYVHRFRQEAVAAARLNAPGIVGVFDTCSDDGVEAIVMELLDARTLRDLLDEHGVLDADTTRRIGLRLLDALEAAHAAGLVHRDVKPSNILLCTDGRVKIADFGIAKADDHPDMTRDESVVGTASYLAPEQLTSADVDGRADLYALGLVLYECLTGRLPFSGDTSAAVAVARLHTDPVPPRRVRADVPPALEAAVMGALARDPAARYPSAAAFRAALLGPVAPVLPARPVPVDPVTAETEAVAGFGRSERSWMLRAFLILLVTAALVVAGLLLREAQRSDEPPATTSTTTAPAGGEGALPVTRTAAVDPQGSGTSGENDDLTDRATDGNPATAWRTESYDSPTFFGAKRGVGIAAVLEERSRITGIRLRGSTNGWSATVYVLDGGDPARFDPATATAVARLDKVRGPVDLPLDAAGRTVVVWITDLGTEVGDGRHRVEVAELTVLGTPGA
ncbi:MAG: serine/threonine-protein kinase [Microthrixaceae bacterium]